MHPSVHCSTIYNSQDMKASQMSINRGRDKDVWCVHTHTQNGIALKHKKSKIIPLAATRVDLEIIILSEVRQ